jgi:ATP-dependent Lon protease
VAKIIDEYTHESGVRGLEKQIAKVARVTAKKIALEEKYPKTVKPAHLKEYLGLPVNSHDMQKGNEAPGVVTGLAWTAMGGEILFIESSVSKGKGVLTMTGNLGDVMKESAHAAFSYIRSNAQKLGIAVDFYKTKDIHVHFPAGAVPKDGPSAGITVTTAMVSALADVPVRRDVAMTGEVSIRGRVLPIGGLKEKTMAALRYGVSTVIIPEDNRRDLDEIDPLVRKSLNFVAVKTVDEVLSVALKHEEYTLSTMVPELHVERNSQKHNNIRQ